MFRIVHKRKAIILVRDFAKLENLTIILLSIMPRIVCVMDDFLGDVRSLAGDETDDDDDDEQNAKGWIDNEAELDVDDEEEVGGDTCTNYRYGRQGGER